MGCRGGQFLQILIPFQFASFEDKDMQASTQKCEVRQQNTSSLSELLVGCWRDNRKLLTSCIGSSEDDCPSMSPTVNCSNVGVVTCQAQFMAETSLFKNWLFECILHLHFTTLNPKRIWQKPEPQFFFTIFKNRKAVECPWSSWTSWLGRWSVEQNT